MKQRARTTTQKQQRHKLIINAAEALLRQSGFDAMTMQSVAEATGLAKGTSYLYFASREALVLAVCDRLFDRLIDDFAASTPEPCNFEQLCQNFAACYARDPLLIELTIFPTAILEPQLDVADFIVAKRATARRFKRLAGIVCTRLAIDGVAGQRLVWRLLTVAGGSAQMSFEPNRSVGGLPADVKAFADLANFQTVFMNAMIPDK